LSSFSIAFFAKAEDAQPSEQRRLPIPIAEIKRSTAVDFEKEILPILKNNCLACHNQTKAKADLVLETPQTILKGGEIAQQGGDGSKMRVRSRERGRCLSRQTPAIG
jgi:hypothetical protein